MALVKFFNIYFLYKLAMCLIINIKRNGISGFIAGFFTMGIPKLERWK